MIELDGRPAGEDALAALALTNYGHFTTLLVEDGRVRGLGLHLERLIRDCRLLFDTTLDPDRVRALARRAVPLRPRIVASRVRTHALGPGHHRRGRPSADPGHRTAGPGDGPRVPAVGQRFPAVDLPR
ncbi:hypothetical protein [Streptomyces sp. DHE17-7]|uniref:hypothetical protein n=1 Tax=Streptomyces sp. DHE17-7 TaxID=2759949 RepID=UPI0022EB966A|nr:hypothetical protein [Streptomyces sp. DHE17-7]